MLLRTASLALATTLASAAAAHAAFAPPVRLA
ncbi:MAG: hypothetical protein JWR63_3521, partial [Conexibacter sp.]|nr:hypothetical protein [Conexibacter sp.]